MSLNVIEDDYDKIWQFLVNDHAYVLLVKVTFKNEHCSWEQLRVGKILLNKIMEALKIAEYLLFQI